MCCCLHAQANNYAPAIIGAGAVSPSILVAIKIPSGGDKQLGAVELFRQSRERYGARPSRTLNDILIKLFSSDAIRGSSKFRMRNRHQFGRSSSFASLT
jgi:hypothetical protein